MCEGWSYPLGGVKTLSIHDGLHNNQEKESLWSILYFTNIFHTAVKKAKAEKWTI